MKKNYLFLLLLICSVSMISFTQISDKPGNSINKNNPGIQTQAVTSRLLNANNISAWYRTNGSFNRNPATGLDGFEWPKGSNKFARFATGIWMGCKSGDDTLTAIAEYSYDYMPGYVDNSGNPQGADDPLYRIYSITRGDTTSPDYLNWPAYQGAYTTSAGTPYFLGTQTMFYSYTDAYPHQTGMTSLQSLKAQILQTNWCYTNSGLGDVQFIEYKIINRSNTQWVDTYIGLWTEDDIGSAIDDAVGCDTARALAYTWNFTDNDPIYGAAPPAVGTKLLRSPIVATGNMSDTVKYYDPPGSQNLKIKVGFKYTGMNIFNTYFYPQQPTYPQNNTEVYRYISGHWRTGESWINPVNLQTTKLAYSGDPVTGEGWVMTEGFDRIYTQSFGPFNMQPNDTQSIIVAQVIAKGTSNLNSITHLRSLSDYVQSIYDNNFQSVLAVNNISTEIPSGYSLSQNYPNPFNPSTVIRYSLSGNRFITLKVFDALGKEVVTLVNDKQNAGTYEVDFDGSGLASGIYFYTLTSDGFSDTKRMILLK